MAITGIPGLPKCEIYRIAGMSMTMAECLPKDFGVVVTWVYVSALGCRENSR